MMFTINLVLAFLFYRFVKMNSESAQYIFEDMPSVTELVIKVFGSFYLLNNSFVPMDLVATTELTKIVYAFWIEQDAEMTIVDSSRKIDGSIDDCIVGCSAQNLSIREDLAQVDYIFCDKTGTLT